MALIDLVAAKDAKIFRFLVDDKKAGLECDWPYSDRETNATNNDFSSAIEAIEFDISQGDEVYFLLAAVDIVDIDEMKLANVYLSWVDSRGQSIAFFGVMAAILMVMAVGLALFDLDGESVVGSETVVVGFGIAIVEQGILLFCLVSWPPDMFPFNHARPWSSLGRLCGYNYCLTGLWGSRSTGQSIMTKSSAATLGSKLIAVKEIIAKNLQYKYLDVDHDPLAQMSTLLLQEEAVAHFLNFHEHIVASRRALVILGYQEIEEVEYEAILDIIFEQGSPALPVVGFLNFLDAHKGLKMHPILGYVIPYFCGCL
ncbi:hypothetical protein GIB67_003416 [Kingdonia uniflora]|uniref:Uncharacterized protein n=1 Tax=Kingdonia uniflora TaxID=39325 RepID=A0A7J7P9R4_9MAGN|nr:hypothetical protein GIB67_003416 [Kingdonia uniflora]